MCNNILLVVNPVSGGIDKTEIIDSALLFASRENIKLEIYRTCANDDILNIKSIIDQLKPARIVIIGGDGTIKLVTDAVDDQDIILGIIPAGSSNGLATDLNLPSLPEESIEVAFGDNFISVDKIAINDEICLHLSDLGLNAELIKHYEETAIHGKLGYVFQIFNTLIDADPPFVARISANNQIIECEARMIVIANAKKYGTGVVINPNGRMDDGKFELIILKNLDLIVFAKILTGNIPIGSEDVDVISTDRATIVTDIPTCFQIDGEYFGFVTELNVELAPSKLKIAVP